MGTNECISPGERGKVVANQDSHKEPVQHTTRGSEYTWNCNVSEGCILPLLEMSVFQKRSVGLVQKGAGNNQL